MTIKPIRPESVTHIVPEEVIVAFNSLIAEYYDGREAVIGQAEAAQAVAREINITLAEVYSKRYLDIEGLYIDAGWDVSYHKPDYNADAQFAPYFVFRKPQ